MVCPAASKGRSEERECALSCCLACPAAGQWGSEKRECALSHWLVCPAARKRKRKEGEKWLAWPFMLPRGGDPGRIASIILIGRNI